MQVHFVVHEAFEAPGAFVDWAAARAHATAFSRVYLGEPLPASPAGIDLLVVLGGPQSPTTTLAECPHFDTQAEQRLIADCIAAGKAVVGVCLGAQLIGAALGAPASPSPEKEIGKFPITLTADGLRNEKFRHFGTTLAVGHWHSDMPGLTPGAVVIAASEGCPRQIVEYAPRVVGLQCHLEFTPAVVDGLIAAETGLPDWQHHRFVESAEALRRHAFAEANAALWGFLDRLVLACRESVSAS